MSASLGVPARSSPERASTIAPLASASTCTSRIAIAGRTLRAALVLALVLGACATPTDQEPPTAPGDGSMTTARSRNDSAPVPGAPWGDPAGDVADAALAELCVEAWELHLASDPVHASFLGDARYDGRLLDNSPRGDAERAAKLRSLSERARAIDRTRLGDGDRITHLFLCESFEDTLAEHDLRIDVASWSVEPRVGPQSEFPTLAADQKTETAEQRAALLARWRAMPAYVDQCVENLRRGVANDRVAPRKAVGDVIAQLDGLLATPLEESALVEPALGGGRWIGERGASSTAPALEIERPSNVSEPHAAGRETLRFAPAADDPLPAEERRRFLEDVVGIVDGAIRPAFARYRDALAEDVLPRARDDEHPGVLHVSGGDAYYRLRIRRETSLDLEPAEIHAIGLAEVARIRAEIAALGEKVFGTSDVAAIQHRLRTEAALHFESAGEIEAKARATLARAEAAVPRAFGIRPRAACEIVPIPAHEAPFTTVAYYRQPAADGSRPGRYYVNTFAPTTRTRYEAEVLAFHEAVPGHHLQIAIAQELEGLPLVRRHTGSTAYVEGWALYTERLCDELGLYGSDVDRLGMLSYDAWRACRLVVDTGLHAFGWSRGKAIAYMVENTLLAENNVANEVDRYIATPGQALAYKLGQREILALRAEARAALGQRFELAAFHDRVLENAAVSLRTLRAVVEDWIARTAKDRP